MVEASYPTWVSHVKTDPMPAEKLTFDDNTFTHNYACFLIFMSQDPAKVASEMYRTQKSYTEGGIGFITSWHHMPHEEAILEAHAATRPKESIHLLPKVAKWKDPEFLKGELEKAGYTVEVSQVDATLDIEHLDKWCRLTWGLTGAPAGGWTEADESNFDDAVGVVKKGLKESEHFESDGNGEHINMVANVATVYMT
jgi:hypothetical protein